jgi:DNA-binding transcriptional LysR family regulator
MRFKGLDLNLLHALQVLLEERSVSRAAERLHLSQPAASAALMRLREFFNDELLILHGKRMIPTSYAEALIPEVNRALDQVETIISASSKFDPGRSERLFRVIASDYIASVLIAPAIQQLEVVAPAVQIDIRQPSEQVIADFARGLVDLFLTPEEFVLPNHPTELLLDEQQVLIGWAENPRMARRLTVDEFTASAQVAVAFGATRQLDYASRYLETYCPGRRIEIFAPSFSVVPWLIVGTQRVAVMHERLARVVAEHLPLKIQELPIEIPPMREMIQFHSARAHDSGIIWLRSMLHDMAGKMSLEPRHRWEKKLNSAAIVSEV